MSRYQEDPEYRELEKTRARNRYRGNQDIRDSQNSKKMARYYSDPVYREKVCAASRAASHKRMQIDEVFRAEQLKRLKILKKLPSKPEAIKRGRKRHKTKVKREAYTALGSVCACCGEDRQEFLSIDHINLDGNKHRAIIGRSPQVLYEAIKKEGFPKDKYRVLCMNCNFATRYGKPCPHESEVLNIIRRKLVG